MHDFRVQLYPILINLNPSGVFHFEWRVSEVEVNAEFWFGECGNWYAYIWINAIIARGWYLIRIAEKQLHTLRINKEGLDFGTQNKPI